LKKCKNRFENLKFQHYRCDTFFPRAGHQPLTPRLSVRPYLSRFPFPLILNISPKPGVPVFLRSSSERDCVVRTENSRLVWFTWRNTIRTHLRAALGHRRRYRFRNKFGISNTLPQWYGHADAKRNEKNSFSRTLFFQVNVSLTYVRDDRAKIINRRRREHAPNRNRINVVLYSRVIKVAARSSLSLREKIKFLFLIVQKNRRFKIFKLGV